jgi:hypothetical protein
MTEELIILDSLRYIKRETNPPTYVNITDKIWWNFDVKRREDLREALRSMSMINYNHLFHWEFQLRSEAYPIINDADQKLEIDFLKSLKKQSNIEFFMTEHFIKPNPMSEFTTHEHDNGVIFLKGLKGQGFIEYDKDDLNHISNIWYEEDPPINKRWFDSVDKNHPFLVELTQLGENYLLLEDELKPATNLTTTQITDQTNTNKTDTWLVSILGKLIDNFILVIVTIVGTVIGTLLVIMIVNYCNGKGFVIK